MVRFINRYTGSEMMVDEARADEYKDRGHKPIAPPKKKPAKKAPKKKEKASE